MIRVVYNKTVSCPTPKSFIEKIITQTARREKKVRGIVELTIVGGAVIRRLNRQWRGQDKVTDVLSFAWGESGGTKSDLLAEIFICYPQIARQAKQYGVSAKEEFARMLIHGILHSVGYDHVTKPQAKKMFNLQEKILASIKYYDRK